MKTLIRYRTESRRGIKNTFADEAVHILFVVVCDIFQFQDLKDIIVHDAHAGVILNNILICYKYITLSATS